MDPYVDKEFRKLNVVIVKASSKHMGPYGPENVLNGLMGQDHGADWSTDGEGVGAWIQLHFSKKTTVHMLKFAGRVRDDKFRKVCVSFSEGSTQELEFPDNEHLNSFNLQPVATWFVRITCLTCHNTKYHNRGAQAIELWGLNEGLNEETASPALRDYSEISPTVFPRRSSNLPPLRPQRLLTASAVAVEETKDIPVLTFRLGRNIFFKTNEYCVLIDGTLDRNSTMESILQDQDVFQEFGVTKPFEYEFMVKKRKPRSFISLRWKQFRSMKVHQLTRLQHVDEHYLVVLQTKKRKGIPRAIRASDRCKSSSGANRKKSWAGATRSERWSG